MQFHYCALCKWFTASSNDVSLCVYARVQRGAVLRANKDSFTHSNCGISKYISSTVFCVIYTKYTCKKEKISEQIYVIFIKV